MALAAMMLRRALPLGSRAFRSPRILPSAAICITADIRRRRKQRLTSDLSRVIGFSQIQQLSTAIAEEPSADENLIKVLEDKINKAPEAVGIPSPDWFPFGIQDHPESWKVVLNRTYGSEVVRIVADLTEAKIDENNFLSSIDVEATVTKPNGQLVKFTVEVAFGGKLSFLKITDSDSELCLSGVSKKMEKAFYKYLEARGIEPRGMIFLFNFMADKEKRERLNLYNKMKNFVAN